MAQLTSATTLTTITVPTFGESLLNEICRDPEALVEWKRAVLDLEVETGRELQGQVSEKGLEAYFEALEVLRAALETGPMEKIMLAQGMVVEAGMEFIGSEP